jgi:hypothetical protein
MGIVLALALVGIVSLMTAGQGNNNSILGEIRGEMIPAEGADTEYGIPLSLNALPQFVEWWYTLVPVAESDPRYFEALNSLVAPCCDDNQAYKCCCETNGNACNIIRSGKGLAAHLILDLDYDTDQIAADVLEWFQFARSDYYLAAELESRGINPLQYGLTTQGSCYRGLCEVPISQGGCGGMTELIEPAIEMSNT